MTFRSSDLLWVQGQSTGNTVEYRTGSREKSTGQGAGEQSTGQGTENRVQDRAQGIQSTGQGTGNRVQDRAQRIEYRTRPREKST